MRPKVKPRKREAAEAYGEPGVDNGVEVKIRKSVKNRGVEVAAQVGAQSGTSGLVYDPNTQRYKQATEVEVRAGLGMTKLQSAVLHEGQHVADRAAFVDAIQYGPGGPTYDFSFNITLEETERRAMALEGLTEPAIDTRLKEKPYSLMDLTQRLFPVRDNQP